MIRRLLLLAVTTVALGAASHAFASETVGTILPSQKYGWGDRMGWINFAPNGTGTYQGLTITDTQVTGYAWSRDFGWINFSPSNGGVTNTSEGVLGGHAWVSNFGWISFSGVTINQNGEFVGIAGTAGTDAGRISFSCSTCAVATDWRPESVRTGGGSNGGNGPGSNPGGGGRSGSSVPSTGTGQPTGTPAAGEGESIEPPVIPAAPGLGTAIRNLISQITGAGNGASTTGEAGQGAPDYLFDITLRLSQNVLPAGNPLTALISFTSFGSRETPVTNTYTIVRSDGTVVATSTESFVVQSENAFSRVFQTTTLAPGNYTLKMHVVYGQGTVDDLQQDFTLTASGKACFLPWPFPWLISHVPLLAWFGCWLPWWILLIIIAIVWYLVHRWRRTHKNLSRK